MVSQRARTPEVDYRAMSERLIPQTSTQTRSGPNLNRARYRKRVVSVVSGPTFLFFIQRRHWFGWSNLWYPGAFTEENADALVARLHAQDQEHE